MAAIFPYQTEEAFLLRSMKEVVMVWHRGTGQASLNIAVKDGKADLQLSFQLGQPWDPHVQQPPPQHHHPRTKSMKQKERDRERAAAHQARKTAVSADSPLEDSDQPKTSPPAAPAGDPLPPPAAPVGDPLPPPTAPVGDPLPPPTKPVGGLLPPPAAPVGNPLPELNQ